MKVLQRFIVFALVALAFGISGRFIYLDYYYYAYAPRQADPASGAVVPVTIHHGAKVFLTEEQWRWFDAPNASVLQFSMFLAAAVAAYLLGKRWRVFRNTYGDRNSN
jgi:hypothetical protein